MAIGVASLLGLMGGMTLCCLHSSSRRETASIETASMPHPDYRGDTLLVRASCPDSIAPGGSLDAVGPVREGDPDGPDMWIPRSAPPPGQPIIRELDPPPMSPPPQSPRPVTDRTDSLTLARYPTIDCPQEAYVGSSFAVQVSLTESLLTPEVHVKYLTQRAVDEAGRLKMSLPEARAWDLDAVLSAPGFIFRGGMNTAKIRLPRKGDSSPAIFFLRPDSTGEFPSARELTATFWHEGNYLGRASRRIRIRIENAGPARTLGAVVQTFMGSSDGPAPAPRSTAIDLGLSPPDLTIFILGDRIIVNSPHLSPSEGQASIPSGLRPWLEAQYAQISSAGAPSLGPSHESGPTENSYAADLLRGVGTQVYQRWAPPLFREAFWRLTDLLGDKFRSIQIYTDDPLLPWELMMPVRSDGRDQRGFLGQEFAVARWHLSSSALLLARPLPELHLQELVLVAPEYEGSLQLPAQEEEISTLRALPYCRRHPARIESLRSLFAQLPEGIIHFAGHGEVRSVSLAGFEYVIRLEDGDLDLMTWRGLTGGRAAHHPLFFFNACKVGQADRVLDFVDGWAPAVLESGASGYIGAAWAVSDHGASRFAELFYRAIQESLARTGRAGVAELLARTRGEFATTADPTFLAYVFYGDAMLQVTPSGRKL